MQKTSLQFTCGKVECLWKTAYVVEVIRAVVRVRQRVISDVD